MFWSREGWQRHYNKKHSGLPLVPDTAPLSSNSLNPLAHIQQLEAVKQEKADILASTEPNVALSQAKKEFSVDYTATEDEIMVVDEVPAPEQPASPLEDNPNFPLQD